MSGDFDVLDWKRDRGEFERWSNEQREGASGVDTSHLVEALGPLFLYLADGYESCTLLARVVALLVVVRPDLIADDSYEAIQARTGVSTCAISRAVALCREYLPTFRGGFRGSLTSINRLVSRSQLRLKHRRELEKLRAVRNKLDARLVERNRRLIEAKRAANCRALQAMRELDRIFGIQAKDTFSTPQVDVVDYSIRCAAIEPARESRAKPGEESGKRRRGRPADPHSAGIV